MLNRADLDHRDAAGQTVPVPQQPGGAVSGTPVGENADSGTRHKVLDLITAHGPVTAVELAERLKITPAGVRRHVEALVASGHIEATSHTVPHTGRRTRRGRPARAYVARTAEPTADAYRVDAVAVSALRYVAEHLGEHELTAFIHHHVADTEDRYREVVEAAGDDVMARARALAAALAEDGYAASARPAPHPSIPGVQLCQGRCPMQQLAEEFPQFCEAETAVFARLLGVHVQRLATMAAGERVCTTFVPHPAARLPEPAPASASTGADAPLTTALERTVR